MKSTGLLFSISLFLAVFFVYFVGGYGLGFGWTIFMLLLALGILLSLPKKLSEYPIKSHREGYLLLIMGCLLALGHSIRDQTHFVIINILLTFPLIVAGGYALNNNISSIPQKFFSFLISGLGDYFHSCFSYLEGLYSSIPTFSKPTLSKEYFTWLTPQVTLSVVLGFLVVIILILPLLASADPVFAQYIINFGHSILDFLHFDFSLDWLINIFSFPKIIIGSLVAMMTGGAMMLMKKYTTLPNYESYFYKIGGQYYNIIITMITVVYILFALVQIKFLFLGGILPEGVTYSEYAVKGFRQLLAILAINVMIFVVSPMTQEKKSYSFLLNAILFLSTCVIRVSCVMRLQLYIDVYQLTWMRLLPWTFSILLLVLLSLVYLGTQKSSISRVSVCFYGVCLWYGVLNLVGVDWIIAKYNVDHPKFDGSNDLNYLQELSNDKCYVKEVCAEPSFYFVEGEIWQEMSLSRILNK